MFQSFSFPGQPSDQGMLEVESAMFKDLVIFNFQETDRNLTVKTLCGLYFANVAFDAKYAYKIDDDVLPKFKKIFFFTYHTSDLIHQMSCWGEKRRMFLF